MPDRPHLAPEPLRMFLTGSDRRAAAKVASAPPDPAGIDNLPAYGSPKPRSLRCL